MFVESPSRFRFAPSERRPALTPLLVIGCAVALLLIVFAHGYGYHRDELYFLAAGHHLAWGYPDQGPLTPFVAHVMSAIDPGSLTVFRVPSALMAAGTVVLTGLIAAEFGGGRGAQLIAAGSTAVGSVVLISGHLLSTTTFDLLAWTAVTWLIARAVRTGDERLWAVAGVVAGFALLNKPLIVFLLVALALALLTAGPRTVLLSRWLLLGAFLALAIWSPWLIWQAAHGWPQLKVASAIANGGSASSQPRWAFIPFQFLLISPLLAPVWLAGLFAIARDPQMRPFRFLAVTWLLLALIFIATGGKPYYLAGMFPVLLAAGAIDVDRWLDRGSFRLRRGLLGAALLLSAVVSALIALPLLPAKDAGAANGANSDVGATIGWPEFARTVASVSRSAGRTPVVFTENYGEAGAIDRYGPALGITRAYSGHNGFADWGQPPDRAGPVVVVGLTGTELGAHFSGCRPAARINNDAGIDNDERGTEVDLCHGTRAPWSQIWGSLRHLG